MAKSSRKSSAHSTTGEGADRDPAAFKTAFDLFAEGVRDYALFMVDPRGVVVSWTTGAERIKGYTAAEAIGKNHSLFYTPEDVAAGLPQEALEVAAKDGRHLAEGWRVRKDGNRFWAEVVTAALREPDGALRGFAKVVRDATHRKTLHAELERAALVNQAQVRAILEVAVDAIITIDSHGKIGVFNRAAQQMFGYTPDEVVGQNVSVLMPQPYKSEHDDYMNNYQRTGRKKIIGIGREVAAIKKDGTIFPIDLAVSEVRVGNDLTFTGIIRDITERKQLEKEILEISEREQRRIGQDLHDGLCQQLTGIAFLMQALQQKLAATDAAEAAQAAQISSLLKEAVNQARNLSHGLYPVDPQPDGLMVALRELASSVRAIFNIDCSFRCPTSVMIADNSAATHLYRIAQEAVQNAVRHGKASRIVIELITTRNGIQISVTDNGVGIPPADQLRSGMGLRTMNHRAHVIGAKFAISRLPKGGSRAVCDLPNTASKGTSS
ncbi:MAG TPA: PAS domain S-box protein [Phycisphaerae bacterium]|nr:PAS domain S-box protein [Phycisphaerae bacterium]